MSLCDDATSSTFWKQQWVTLEVVSLQGGENCALPVSFYFPISQFDNGQLCEKL